VETRLRWFCEFFVRIIGSGYFKNFKEPTLFMKELTGFGHVP
jgi:hypothetical protein